MQQVVIIILFICRVKLMINVTMETTTISICFVEKKISSRSPKGHGNDSNALL